MKKILAVALLSTVALGCSSVNLNKESKSTKYFIRDGVHGGTLIGLNPEMKRIPGDIMGEERLSFMDESRQTGYSLGDVGDSYYDTYMRDEIGTGISHWIIDRKFNEVVEIRDMGKQTVPSALILVREYVEGSEDDARKLYEGKITKGHEYNSRSAIELKNLKERIAKKPAIN